MKNLVKIFALALVACMMLSLCACSADTENNEDTVADKETKADSETEAETEAKVTLPDTDDETEAPAVDAVLTVNIVDTEGNPVPNVFIQVCDDSTCNNATSNAEGKAIFTTDHFDAVEEGFTCSLIVCPAGYECEFVGDNKAYLEAGISEFTIELTKVD